MKSVCVSLWEEVLGSGGGVQWKEWVSQKWVQAVGVICNKRGVSGRSARAVGGCRRKSLQAGMVSERRGSVEGWGQWKDDAGSGRFD